MKLALGVVSVEDDAIDQDSEGLDDYFNDTANQGPGLQNELVVE